MSQDPSAVALAAQAQHVLQSIVIHHTTALVGAITANPLASLAADVITGSTDLAEMEKRYPYLLAYVDALAMGAGQSCNAWPPGEREKMLQRALDRVRSSFESGRAEVDAMMAAANPMHGMTAGAR